MVLVALTPRASDAALITYDVTPGAPITFDGTFQNLNDVALFQFTLDEGTYNFSAATISTDIGGFDPNLALYLNGELYTYTGAGGAPYYAVEDDTIGLDAMFEFLLTGGVYTLALAHTGNSAPNSLSDPFNWDGIQDVVTDLYNGATCETEPTLCGSAVFSLTVDIAPVNTTVPEPGTLSLMALGSLATACLRRRRTRSVTTRQ
jgi:hypothetical protein